MGSNKIVVGACVALVAVFVSTALQGCGDVPQVFCDQELAQIESFCHHSAFDWKAALEVKKLQTQELWCKNQSHKFDQQYRREHSENSSTKNCSSLIEFRVFAQYKCSTIGADELAANLTIIAETKTKECTTHFKNIIGPKCENQSLFSSGAALNAYFNYSHTFSWYHHIELDAAQKFAFVSESIANVENYTDALIDGKMHVLIKKFCQVHSVDFYKKMEIKMVDAQNVGCNFEHKWLVSHNHSQKWESDHRNESHALEMSIKYEARCKARSTVRMLKKLEEGEKQQAKNCTTSIEKHIDAGINLESLSQLSTEFFKSASVDLTLQFNHTLHAEFGIIANSSHEQMVAAMDGVDNNVEEFELPLGLSSKLAPHGLNDGFVGASVCATAAAVVLVVNRYRKGSQTPREMIIGGDDFVEDGLLAE